VLIEKTEKQYSLPSVFSGKKGDEVTIYADTPLAFFNEYGLPRYEVKAEDFGLTGIVCWERCQLRTRQYSPWNGKRKTRDADRLVIDKGSVFVIHLTGDCTSDKMQQGVGAFRNEGLGQVIFNPSFLKGDETGNLYGLKLKNKTVIPQKQKLDTPDNNAKLSPAENLLNKLLENEAAKDKARRNNYDLINGFIQNNGRAFKEISNSQWGNIRQKAFEARGDKNYLLKVLFGKDKKGYLMHGQMAELWERKGRRKKLEDFIENPDVTPLTVEMLAQEIVKHNK
jgi:hypothetical protein